MAATGQNGNNETLTGNSSSISLAFYDNYFNEIEISFSSAPIDVIIERGLNLSKSYSYQYVNVSEINNNISNGSLFLQNAFNITSNNASIHIELLPLNSNIGYLVFLKLGHIPILNSTYLDYDAFKVFCPGNPFLSLATLLYKRLSPCFFIPKKLILLTVHTTYFFKI
jgi:hypothetical protein